MVKSALGQNRRGPPPRRKSMPLSSAASQEGSDLLFDLFANGFFDHLQIVRGLEIEPEFGRSVKETGNAKRSIGCNGTGAIQDSGYTVGRHVQCLGKGIGSHADFGKLFLKHLAWMYGPHGIHFLFLSMIVNKLRLVWTVFPPIEANTPLLVYAYALLAGPVSPQRFKTITGKVHQILDTCSAVKYLQSPLSLPGNGLKTPNSLTMVEFFSMLAGK